ncbi:helix-turn-helix transcriptional regulator [Chromobacterium haemolyticum]|uniref:HTH cro/C1-type domain-containing protein n=1 Tax=Chromobacterium haemolyticum TaxID=394935 RepID=A0A1W0CCN5_9NEIS|nr:helix-turn-helix transcriptional regulator [Chromobacterium haemolyticum]OQS32489.1 hypothetical protein B0T45_21690 [Chromobacterium haemolyticum]
MNPIREARQKLDLTQPELAKRVGVTQGHISSLERGNWKASPELAKRLALELGISAMDILFPDEKQQGQQ